jgi:hypothetical protein
MKRYLQTLARTLLPTLAGAACGSLLAGVLIVVVYEAKISFQVMLAGLQFGVFGFFTALMPAYLWGASIYAFFRSRGQASYVVALLIGALPGVLLLIVQPTGFAQLYLYFGIAISVCTHFFAKYFDVDRQIPER